MTDVTLAVRALVVAAVDAGRRASSPVSVPGSLRVSARFGPVSDRVAMGRTASAVSAGAAAAGGAGEVAAVTSALPSSSSWSPSRCTATS